MRHDNAAKGCVRVDIDAFLDKYIKGASVPIDLMVALTELSDAGFSYADIPNETMEQVRKNYEKAIETERRLSKCVELNNRGIEYEKTGKQELAIQAYEENVADGYPATHSFDRLMILYRKRKDYDREIAVCKRALDILGKENTDRYKRRLEKARQLKDKQTKI